MEGSFLNVFLIIHRPEFLLGRVNKNVQREILCVRQFHYNKRAYDTQKQMFWCAVSVFNCQLSVLVRYLHKQRVCSYEVHFFVILLANKGVTYLFSWFIPG